MTTTQHSYVQKYVSLPQFGEVVSVASGHKHKPAVIVGFGKAGNIQIWFLHARCNRKHAVLSNHPEKLMRIDIHSLTLEERLIYDTITQKLKE